MGEQISVTIEETKERAECRHERLRSYDENRAIVCADCGLVLSEKTEKKDQDTPRHRHRLKGTGDNLDIHRTTRIHRCFSGLGQTALILDRWQQLSKASDQTDANFSSFLTEITRLCIALSLPKSVFEKAADLSKLIVEKSITKGRSMRALCAATVYAACRQCGIIRTLGEIAKSSKIEKKDIANCYRIVVEELRLIMPSTNLGQYVSRLLNQVRVEGNVAEIVDKLLKAAEESKITSGRDPIGVASALVYVGSKLAGKKITQREISNAADVTEATIRHRCKEIEKHCLSIVPPGNERNHS